MPSAMNAKTLHVRRFCGGRQGGLINAHTVVQRVAEDERGGALEKSISPTTALHHFDIQ